MSAATPANRAARAMFVVAEVHPFTDGNGRTAYISALKAMSTNSLPTPLARMLSRAGRFSRWVNMTSKAAAFADLKRSNALGRPETDKLVFADSIASAPLAWSRE